VFLAFLFLNLTQLYIYKLKKELKEYWTTRKMSFLLFGFLGGTLIALSPILIGLVSGQLHSSEIAFNSDISIASIGLTFIIIAWEELWFRGLFLNYCNRHLSSIHLSLTIGFLFMLIHILNPQIHLLKTGTALFFAGALLTILYFYFKTIWLPLGLHFGNNFTETFIKTNKETDIWIGNEGYLTTIVLAGLFFFFFIKTKKNITVA
jgi:membrane protease YdiL (CAAX protease family)